MVISSLLLVTLLQAQPAAPPPPQEPEHLTARADVQVMRRQFDAAIAAYRQALALSPGHPIAHKGLGKVFDLQGRHAEAQAEYEAAMRRANQFEIPELLRLLTISLTFERRYDDAERRLRQWLDGVLVKTGGELPMGYLGFYDLAMARGDVDSADRALDTFYGPLRPSQASAGAGSFDAILGEIEWARYQALKAAVAARRGQAEQSRTRLRDADARLRAALKRLMAAAPPGQQTPPLDRDVDEMMFPAGEVAFWLGDTAAAIRAMAPMGIKLARHNFMLGQAYEKEGNVAAARDAYRRLADSVILSIDLAWARPIAEARLKALGG